MPKRIGLLFGMEREFPGVIAEEINRRGRGEVVCEPAIFGAPRIDKRAPYDLILDRINEKSAVLPDGIAAKRRMAFFAVLGKEPRHRLFRLPAIY